MILRGTTADFRGVELAFFRLKNDVSEAQLLALSEQVDNPLLVARERRPLCRRNLCNNTNQG